MNKFGILLCAVGLAVLLAGCGSAAGPQAWIDQPLADSHFTQAPISILAHASDQDGVGAFEFYVDDVFIRRIEIQPDRLAEANWQWEPDGPGEFNLRVIPFDSDGNQGEMAQTRIFIADLDQEDRVALGDLPLTGVVRASIDQVECLNNGTVALTFSIFAPLGIERYSLWNTVIQAEHQETFQGELPTSLSKTVQVREFAPDDFNRGHQWGLKVIAGSGGQPFYTYAMEPNNRCPGHYKNELAPAASSTVDLSQAEVKINATCRRGPANGFAPAAYFSPGERVGLLGKLSGGSWLYVERDQDDLACWIAADLLDAGPGLVAGLPVMEPPSLPTAAPTSNPTTIPSPTPLPDTTQPAIAAVSANPTTILTQGPGCSNYSRTTTVQATVTDAGVINSVIANWSVGGSSGQAIMNRVDGDVYEGTIGPLGTTGSLAITVSARDASNNTAAAAPVFVSVQNCIQ